MSTPTGGLLRVGETKRLNAKWYIKKVSSKSVDCSDGWNVYNMIVYNDGRWGWDFPERVPQYVKKAAYAAVVSQVR